jgi:ribosomal-protein-alanine N-acetyltransferase
MTAIPDPLATERLLLSRSRLEDLGELIRFAQNVQTMATLGGVRTAEQTREGLQRHLDHWAEHGFGWWTMRDRVSGAFIGRGGLRHVVLEGVPEVEIGYGLLPEYWGQGLAAEMSREALRLGFDVLGLQSIVSFTLPTNLRSRRVMEKVGLRFERNVIWADLPHVLYRIDRATAGQSTRSADT